MKLLVPALCAVLLCLAPLSATAWLQSTSSLGAGLHWTTNCVSVYINERGSTDIGDGTEFDTIKASLDEWSDLDCSSFRFQFAGFTNFEITGYADEHPAINLITFKEKKWPYTTRPVAYTAVTYSTQTGEIRDADVEMNSEDFEFTTQPEKEPWKIDLQSALTHELGHVLGLDHTDEPEATMYTKAIPGQTGMRSLHEDDKAGICALYPKTGGSQCLEVTPKYLHYDFAEIPQEGGCSTSGRAGSPTLLMVALTVACLALLRRKRYA